MIRLSRPRLRRPVVVAVVALLASLAAADTVTLKNGLVYRGAIDKDNTIVSIFDPDGLKRVILRDSKIASTQAESGAPALQHFPIVQPLTVHAGEMPRAAYNIKAGPWDKSGRRSFQYRGPTSKLVEMQQAIIDLGPRASKIRGIDGFWVSQIATSTIPREVVLGVLAKADQTNIEQRIQVCRFLIQAEWYAEARSEVERLKADFGADPEVARKMENARASILESEGRGLLVEVEARRKAQQPRAVLAKLRSFSPEGMPADVVASVRDLVRKEDTRAASDRALSDAVRRAAEEAKIDPKDRGRLLEILEGLAQAPDAIRARLEAFEKGQAEGARPSELYALALSGWVAGTDSAVKDPKAAEVMATARDLARQYLASPESGADARASALEALRGLDVGGSPLSLALLTEIVRRSTPPLLDVQSVKPGEPARLRIRDDPNPEQPSEYALLLPPEYSPLRSYPMVVALHGPGAPRDAIDFWSAEAQKRGYIVIAPEYRLRDARAGYGYTESEHAAVILALRDALKRFSADPDRVFLAGSLVGGDMAWDFGQSHPDLFAGVAVVSGWPAKYVWATKPNLERVPFYVAMGDLAPAESDVVFGVFARPVIARNQDFTYVEYYRRGLEDFPEEAGAILDWMGPRRREPTPKAFEAVAARDCDSRFYGLVVDEFASGRTKEPAAVDIQGKNIAKPASLEMKANATTNALVVNTSGVKRLEVWVSPKLIDFAKPKMEIRVNGKSVFRDKPRPDIETMLEDIRVRGDHSQVYWMKVAGSIGGR